MLPEELTDGSQIPWGVPEVSPNLLVWGWVKRAGVWGSASGICDGWLGDRARGQQNPEGQGGPFGRWV